MKHPTTARQWLLVSCLGAAAIFTLAAGGYFFWLRTPPSMPRTAEQAVDLIQSERFKRLPESRKLAYYRQSDKLMRELDDDKRRELWRQTRENDKAREAMRQLRMTRAVDRAREFAAADTQQQQQILDGMIDRMEQWQQRRRERPAGERPERQQQQRPERPEREQMTEAQRQQRRDHRAAQRRDRFEDRIETGNPQHQAYMQEFWSAMRQRMEERGIEFPQRGRGGRGR